VIPDTATDLALMLSKRARHQEAHKIALLALSMRIAVRGLFNPKTLQSRSSLATAIRGLGSFRNAQIIYTRVLDTYRKLLSDDTPETLDTINNLALTLRELGRFNKAINISAYIL